MIFYCYTGYLKDKLGRASLNIVIAQNCKPHSDKIFQFFYMVIQSTQRFVDSNIFFIPDFL